MNKNITKVLKFIELIIFIALIILAILMISPFLPTKDKISTFVVASGSMEPSIQTGSIALITSLSNDSLKTNDVISFESPSSPGTIIIHRIVRVNSEGKFITKGDNNNVEDQWTITKDKVKGKLLFSIPYLGYLNMNLKDPRYFGLFVVIPFLIFFGLQINKIRIGIKEEVEKRTLAAIKAHTKTSISSITDA